MKLFVDVMFNLGVLIIWCKLFFGGVGLIMFFLVVVEVGVVGGVGVQGVKGGEDDGQGVVKGWFKQWDYFGIVSLCDKCGSQVVCICVEVFC